jgi:hypothetical protein
MPEFYTFHKLFSVGDILFCDFRSLQEKELVIVPGATHLFEEPGTLEKVSEFAANWFVKYLF